MNESSRTEHPPVASAEPAASRAHAGAEVAGWSHGEGDPGGLSLERKLAFIARDRAVLSVLRLLADRGLQDGDRVCHAITGQFGRLIVARDVQPPGLRVQLEGSLTLVDASDLTVWRHA